MKHFDILDRHLCIHQNTLLEASAGTGKTFSMENLVVRLLIESDPATGVVCSLSQILAVTFTRKAAQELRIRIQNCLKTAISILETQKREAPDYLLALLDAGNEKITKALHSLHYAYFSFQEAQIFTIHGFCARILKDHLFAGNLTPFSDELEMRSHDDDLEKLIYDYLLTELTPEKYGTAQLQTLFKKYSVSKLMTLLSKKLQAGTIIAPTSFQELFKQFSEKIKWIKTHLGVQKSQILHDFFTHAKSFKGICDREGNPKPENIAKVEAFAAIFEKETIEITDFERQMRDDLYLPQAFDSENLKAKALSQLSINYAEIYKELKPMIREANSESHLLAQLAFECQGRFKQFLKEEERWGYQELLTLAYEAVQQPAFADQVSALYKAVIIDEFQDTDPIQWNLFKTMFLAKQGAAHLYLVGDPKQSIYAFRQADIYTYLNAAHLLGEENRHSLSTNYRSLPELVEALNFLFDAQRTPGLFSLPKYNQVFPYPAVQSSNIQGPRFTDERGFIHFFSTPLQKKYSESALSKMEEEFFFPFITNEIIKLKQSLSLSLKEFAILVRDRNQANRIHAYFQSKGLPTHLQRTSYLSDSQAITALQEFLHAVLNPHDESCIKVALGGPILNLSQAEILYITKIPEKYAENLSKFYHLRHLFLKDGAASFFHALWKMSFQDNQLTVAEHLLSQSNFDFYHHLEQLMEIIVEFETEKKANLDQILLFLEEFSKLDEEKKKCRQDTSQEAISILTLHMSKGLEFGIVFALGLINRLKNQDDWITVSEQNDVQLKAVFSEDPQYMQFLEERDAEKIRQLYVAATRAKYRLYLPVLNSCDLPSLGTASPMELFLARVNQPPSNWVNIYDRMGANLQTPLLNLLQNQTHLTYSALENLMHLSTQTIEKIIPELIAPPTLTFSAHQTTMLSFSQLATASPIKLAQSPHGQTITLKTVHTLPSGKECGLFLHAILQKIRFDQEIDVHSFCKGSIFEEWEQIVNQIIFNTLYTPLFHDTFCLAQLQPDEYYREIEFLYETGTHKTYMRGVIDFLFIYQNRYYLIDWKSNWLGDNINFYNQINMKNAMQENQYELQAEIYIKAIKKYLHIIDKRSFEDCFGGVFYLFLRGLDPNQTDSGILFFNK